jgi:acyl carrier protein
MAHQKVDPDQLLDEARHQIAARSNVDVGQVAADSELAYLGLDSVDIAEVGEEWRRRYDVEVDVDDILNMTTVWDVVEAVTSKLDKGPSADATARSAGP